MKLYAIFGLSASVDNRPLPGARVAGLLGVVLGVQDHKKIKFPLRVYSPLVAKGLNKNLEKFIFFPFFFYLKLFFIILFLGI